jgi:hypothetical protein
MALDGGVPESVVEWWLGFARPQLVFGRMDESHRLSGVPVAGQYGGHPLLPADVEWDGFPHFVASIDCAALPRDLPDFPLPHDGSLLFFADKDEPEDFTPQEWETRGRVLYVAAGTPTSERIPSTPPDWQEHFREPFPMFYTQHWSLPGVEDATVMFDPEADARFQEYNLDAYRTEFSLGGIISLGGHCLAIQDDPCCIGEDEHLGSRDWRLLADWTATLSRGVVGCQYWIMPREDMDEPRFDRLLMATQLSM